MGSLVDALKCSVCGNIAYNEASICDCLRQYRMQEVNGQRVFAWNIGIDYEELSVVDIPAEKNATTRKVYASKVVAGLLERLPGIERARVGNFARAASADEVDMGAVYASLFDLDGEDLKYVRKFVELNRAYLPDYILKILGRI